MIAEKKEMIVAFKADAGYIDRINAIRKKLDLDRSKTIRLAIDEMYKKYISPENVGDLVVISQSDITKSIVNGSLLKELVSQLLVEITPILKEAAKKKGENNRNMVDEN